MKNGKNRLVTLKCLLLLTWAIYMLSNLKRMAEYDTSLWRLIVIIPCTLLVFYFIFKRGN